MSATEPTNPAQRGGEKGTGESIGAFAMFGLMMAPLFVLGALVALLTDPWRIVTPLATSLLVLLSMAAFSGGSPE